MKKRVKVNEYQEKKLILHNNGTGFVWGTERNDTYTNEVEICVNFLKWNFFSIIFLMIQMEWGEACRLIRSLHLKYYLLITETI